MDLRENLKVSEYVHVRIDLDSAYKWGRGWTPVEAEAFKEDVYPKLEEAGFKIEIAKNSYSSDYLKTVTPSPTSIYMHPMEFTGYATAEEVDKMVAALKSCTTCEIRDVQTKETYKLSDYSYRKLLEEHSKEILELVKEAKSKCSEHFKFDATNFAFRFAEKYRVPRVGDNSGVLGNSDVDCEWIINFIGITEALGLV